MQNIKSYLISFLIIALVFGCKKDKKDISDETKQKTKKATEFPVKGQNNSVVEYDVDKNGKKDLKAFYDERGHLSKLEIDTNENGVKDRVIFYRFHPRYGESKKVSEQFDDNEDGFLDAEKTYDGEKFVSAWYDTDYNRHPDIWQSLDKYEHVVTKIDSDGDGKPDPGGDHIVNGNDKMENKQYSDAYEEYKMALNYNSRSFTAYWGMAQALEFMHNYEMAIKHYERYILLKGPQKEQANRKINYLKNKLNQDFRK